MPAKSKSKAPSARSKTSSKPSKKPASTTLPAKKKSAATRPTKPAKAPSASTAKPDASAPARDFAIAAARSLTDDKCRDVVVIDVRGRSQVTDFTVIATGSSDRQMRSAGEHVDEIAEKRGIKLYRHNLKEPGAKWVLLDFVDVVVHVFEPDTRLYYDIEMLWGDAPRVAWERPGDLAAREADAPIAPLDRNRAGLRRGEVLR